MCTGVRCHVIYLRGSRGVYQINIYLLLFIYLNLIYVFLISYYLLLPLTDLINFPYSNYSGFYRGRHTFNGDTPPIVFQYKSGFTLSSVVTSSVLGVV